MGRLIRLLYYYGVDSILTESDVSLDLAKESVGLYGVCSGGKAQNLGIVKNRFLAS